MRPLWLIADKMSFRKDEGKFKTCRDAYRWATKNLSTLKGHL